MNIFGEKRVLRAIEPEDNKMLLELINDPETERMLGGTSWPVSMDSQMKWYAHLDGSSSVLRCIVADQKDNSPLGTLIMNEIDQRNGVAHIHVKMAAGETRGKGYGTDAVNTIVQYAFEELRLHCVFANVISYNAASIRMLEKCGFHRDGILRERVYKQGKYFDEYTYSKLATDE